MPHPMQRKEDHTALGKVNHYIDTYKPLVLLAYGLLLLFGAKLVWPRDILDSHEKRLTAVEEAAKHTNDALAVLVRLRCFDKDVSAAQRELAGLDCTRMHEAQELDNAVKARP